MRRKELLSFSFSSLWTCSNTFRSHSLFFILSLLFFLLSSFILSLLFFLLSPISGYPRAAARRACSHESSQQICKTKTRIHSSHGRGISGSSTFSIFSLFHFFLHCLSFFLRVNLSLLTLLSLPSLFSLLSLLSLLFLSLFALSPSGIHVES